jgi:hypothetical protein
MISERVDLDKIRSSRRARNPAGIQELAADIAKHGLKQPLVLRPDMVIIEGLRRLLALKLLKEAHVDVVISNDLDEVCDYLHEMHGQIKVDNSLRRLAEIHEDLVPLITIRRKLLHSGGPWSGGRSPYGPTREARDLVAYALHVQPISLVERARRLYSREHLDEETAELCRMVDTGEFTISQALRILMRNYQLATGSVSGEAAQLELLRNVTRSLTLATRQIQNLARPIEISAGDLAPVIAELRQARSALVTMTRELERIHK